MLDHLVTPSGTKIAHGVGDLAKYAGTAEKELLPVLTKLGDERILRSVAADGERDSRYEIFHDTLAEPVLAWKAAHETQSELDRERADVRTGGTAACSGCSSAPRSRCWSWPG